MKEITFITSQKKKGDRLNIFLDGEFAFGVEYETAIKFGLKKGVVLSDEKIELIHKEEGLVAAFNRGLGYAVKKAVSEKQMNDYLHRRGYAVEACKVAVSKLKEYGYIDDEKFVKAYIATYGNSLGRRRIELGLKQAGVDRELIDAALGEKSDEASCDNCIAKYLRTHKEPDKKKLISYLTYRGFDWDEIDEAINRSGLWK